MQVRRGFSFTVRWVYSQLGEGLINVGRISGNLRYDYIVHSRSTKDGCIFAIYS